MFSFSGKTMRARGIVIHGERLRYLSEDQLDYITANVDQVRTSSLVSLSLCGSKDFPFTASEDFFRITERKLQSF